MEAASCTRVYKTKIESQLHWCHECRLKIVLEDKNRVLKVGQIIDEKNRLRFFPLILYYIPSQCNFYHSFFNMAMQAKQSEDFVYNTME